jgi:glucose dehydrogenase
VFLPTTSPSDGLLRRRPAASTFRSSNSIVALDGATGSGEVAFRQVVHHDLFDYDLVGHPLLVDIRRNGKHGAGRAAADQDGLALRLRARQRQAAVADRRDGPCRRPTYRANVAAKTQPVPTGMAPFARQTMKREELFGLTPLDRLACQRTFRRRLRYEGMYTPPSQKWFDCCSRRRSAAATGAAPRTIPRQQSADHQGRESRDACCKHGAEGRHRKAEDGEAWRRLPDAHR